MKLSTIWTLPGMSLAERLRRTEEVFVSAIARRLPDRIAYWSFIHLGVKHIRSDEVVPEVGYTEILQRISKGVER